MIASRLKGWFSYDIWNDVFPNPWSLSLSVSLRLFQSQSLFFLFIISLKRESVECLLVFILIFSQLPLSNHFPKELSITWDMSSSQCLENPPTLNPDYGVGTLEELGGLNTYVTAPSDSKLAILLANDAFGNAPSSFSSLILSSCIYFHMVCFLQAQSSHRSRWSSYLLMGKERLVTFKYWGTFLVEFI